MLIGELLENRWMMVATSYARLDTDGVLRVYGNDLDNRISIYMEYGSGNGDNSIIVSGIGSTGGVSIVTNRLKFDWNKVRKVAVYGLGGNDDIRIGGNSVITVPEGTPPPQLYLPAYIDGGTGKDYLVGSEKSDTLLGGNGNDYLVGGGGDDSLDGGQRNDILIGGLGRDIFRGGAGIDAVSYIDRSNPVTVRLTNYIYTDQVVMNSPSGELGENDHILYDIENAIGGSGNDSISGNEYDNLLIGAAGNDTIIGNAGNDQLTGDTGIDAMFGGDGEDGFDATSSVYGKLELISQGPMAGIDRIVGGEGRDRAFVDNQDIVQSISDVIKRTYSVSENTVPPGQLSGE